MEKFNKDTISGLQWLIDNPKYVVVISHGMAEHAQRYDYFANKLNKAEMAVFAIDQIGHGDAIERGEKGYWPKGGFQNCVDNLKTLVDLAKSTYPNKPIILFGHSMGSFISQEYIKQYGDSLNSVILSGSTKVGGLHKMGNFIAHFFFAFGDNHQPNKFLDNLSFGAYNKPFKPNRTGFDWLSRDTQQVDKYIADPLCGYVCTTGFFKAFLTGLSKLNNHVDKIPESLPIYIMSGQNDPVGGQKGAAELKHMYLDKKIKSVDLKLYKEGRHEMLNEINRDEVISDIIIWIRNHN